MFFRKLFLKQNRVWKKIIYSLLISTECPLRLFTFQSPSWLSYNYNGNTFPYFTPLVAGRDFVNDVRVCRFTASNNVYIYGFEVYNGGQMTCVGATDPNLTEVNLSNSSSAPRSSYGYEVLFVPKSLNIAWVNQRSYPKFPKLSPTPLGVPLSSTVTAYLARCKITPDEAFDPALVLRIPGVKLSFSDPSSLSVSYNGFDYTCDQEDLEFAVCM